MINKDKKYLLEESSVFCMLPWIHLHTTPVGDALPCCISKNRIQKFGNTINQSIGELINSESMKTLRLNMLTDIENITCQQCYAHEQQGIRSFRKTVNEDYDQYFEEAVMSTNNDGYIPDFKMRYFDIRFSNICNFKCRTCSAEYSSQWEIENNKHNFHPNTFPKNNHVELIDEILQYIPFMEAAYFAGGEPLITEEHYIMLEEMIRTGNTDIRLSYNTNLSNFKFKDKDVLDLWKHFTHGVYVAASIDHFGERAEYIRHGTNWGVVESNLRKMRSLPYVKTTINTVVSLYNYYTLDEFYNYLLENDFYRTTDSVFGLYNMVSPFPMTSQVLPQDLKKEAYVKITALKDKMTSLRFNEDFIKEINGTISWAESADKWDSMKESFVKEINRVDNIRGESFVKTFPELSRLFE